VLKIVRIFDRTLDILMLVACGIFTCAMLLVCADVVLRYWFNRPLGWSIEICEFILVGMVSFGMAWLLREEGHVKVDFLLNRFRLRSQAFISGVTSMLGSVCVLVVTFYGFKETFRLMETGAVESGQLNIEKFYLLIPLGIGFFLFFLELIRRSYRQLKASKELRENIIRGK